jgi:hypothetical protein
MAITVITPATGTVNGLYRSNAVYNQITDEDFADQLDRVQPAQTPFLTFCRNEVKLKSMDRAWNVDSFPDPKGAVGRADNETAPASSSALSRDWSANIRKMGNIAQGFSETWRLGWQADVPKIAGVTDIAARARESAYQMLKQHMEVAFCSFDQVAVYDQGSGLGAVCAGYRKLTDNANKYASPSAYAIGKATDLHYAPTAACSTAALTATHNRAMWKSVSKALRTAAKQSGDWTLIASLGLRQAVTDLTDATTAQPGNASAIAATQIRVVLAGEQDSILGASVDVIRTDFGRIMVTDSDYIGTTTTDSTGGALTAVNTAATARALATSQNMGNAGIIVKRGNTFKTWAKMPYTQQLGADGGGDAFDSKCLATWGIDNPVKAGWLYFT